MADSGRDVLPNASFGARVAAIVAAIPRGSVATYGQVAALAGRPRAARLVGGILRNSAEELPWHRVVNAQGGISTYKIGAGDLQAALLRSEGVDVDDGRIDLRRYRWVPVVEGGSVRLGDGTALG